MGSEVSFHFLMAAVASRRPQRLHEERQRTSDEMQQHGLLVKSITESRKKTFSVPARRRNWGGGGARMHMTGSSTATTTQNPLRFLKIPEGGKGAGMHYTDSARCSMRNNESLFRQQASKEQDEETFLWRRDPPPLRGETSRHTSPSSPCGGLARATGRQRLYDRNRPPSPWCTQRLLHLTRHGNSIIEPSGRPYCESADVSPSSSRSRPRPHTDLYLKQ